MPFIHHDDSFLISQKEKCKKLIESGLNDKANITEFLISLHIVLELSINSFFRMLILIRRFGDFKISDIDQISFIDKITLFLYLPYFSKKSDFKILEEKRKAIGKIKNFTEVRNKLLHGHIDGRVFNTKEDFEKNKPNKLMPTTKLLCDDKVTQQINDFKFIIESLKYFVDLYWDSMGIDNEKSQNDIIDVKSGLFENYLDYSFLENR